MTETIGLGTTPVLRTKSGLAPLPNGDMVALCSVQNLSLNTLHDSAAPCSAQGLSLTARRDLSVTQITKLRYFWQVNGDKVRYGLQPDSTTHLETCSCQMQCHPQMSNHIAALCATRVENSKGVHF